MEFLIDLTETDLKPEKLEGLYYNAQHGEFVAAFTSVHELYRFVETYGEVRIAPPQEGDELPRITVLAEETW